MRGDVKAFPRFVGRRPGEGEAQEGIGLVIRLNPVWLTTDPDTVESPEGGAKQLGVGGNIDRAVSGTARGLGHIERWAGGVRGKTPEE